MAAPDASMMVTLAAHRPTTSSRPAHSGPAEYQCLPPTRTLPFLSALRLTYSTHRNGLSGSASMAATSSSKRASSRSPFL